MCGPPNADTTSNKSTTAGSTVSTASTAPAVTGAYPQSTAPPAPAPEQTSAQPPGEKPASGPNSELDLCFLCDATGSMGSYIRAAQKHICEIATKVAVSECADVRFALVSYRDHPPQDSTYVTRVFPFTAAVEEMQQYVGTMSAAGGGDGPEAVTAALDDAHRLPWRPNATKIAVLIADAPPHGLEPTGDGFPNGDPEGRDPLEIARRMAEDAITVYAVGCEPALGGYRFARDFMCSLAEITGGQAIALSSAEKLADVIINGSAEEISLTRLSREVEGEVERVRAAAPDLYAAMGCEEEREETAHQQAWSNLKSRGVMSKQMRHDGGMVQQYASVWKGAKSLSAAKAELCEKEGDAIRGMDEDSPIELACKGMDSMAFRSSKSKIKSKKGGSAVFSAMRGMLSSSPPSVEKTSGGGEVPEAPLGTARCARAAPAEAKSVRTNVLVEEEISYDQVKRIMARKSKK